MASLSDLYQGLLFPKIQLLVLSLIALLLVPLIYCQYQYGLYQLSLVSGCMLATLVLQLLYLVINQDRDPLLFFNYLFLCLMCAGVMYQLFLHASLMAHMLVLIPILLYFSIPIKQAVLLNLLALLVLIGLVNFVLPSPSMYLAVFFLAFSITAFCFCYFCVMHDLHLKKLALTDSISGAYNQEHFKFMLEREIAREEVTQQSTSLIGVVLSDYQQMTELHGKRNMLKLLPDLMQYINDFIRGEDDLFRMEEDTFVLVLPNCPEEGAIVLLERLKRKLQEKNWEPFSEVAIQVEAVTHQQGESISAVKERLWKKLNKSKGKRLQITAFS